jgi:branched-chain amino acid transport system substrate-binding protein
MTRMKLSRRTVLGGLAASATVLSGSYRGARAQSGPIKIGIMQSLGGALGVIGNAHLTGTQIAIDQVNAAGGINGRQLTLEVRDNKFSPDAAVTNLREFAGSGINIVIGDGFSSINLATVPLLKDLGVLMVSPSTVLMRFTHEDFSPNFFRSGPNAYMQFNGQTVLLAKDFPNVKRWGAIQLDNAGFAESYDMSAATMKKNYKTIAKTDVELIEPVLVKAGATDFRTAVNKLMSQNLDGIIIALAGGDAVSFMKQAKPFGLLESLKAVCDQNLNITAGPLLKQDLPKGFITPIYWYASAFADLPMAIDYGKRWTEKTNQKVVDPFSTNTHTGMTGLAAAMKLAKSTETGAVATALAGLEFDSLHGKISFRKEDHQLMMSPGFLEVAPSTNADGYENKRYVRIPVDQAIEPASPGKAFTL